MRPFFVAAPVKAPTLFSLLIALLAVWAYAPGLRGSFLFDDFVNLSALGEFGGVRDLPTLWLYLTSAHGDPLGRPLAMLSFLLDARDWPAAPYPFLRSNLALHLLNGLLLAALLSRLGRLRGLDNRTGTRAALLGAALWLLHPLFLSTTLYAVQRECMLAATFVLLGFLCWTSGRARLAAGKHWTGLAVLAFGSLGCTALAVLCKANGALLPLLLLVAEATVLPAVAGDTTRTLRHARTLFLVVPSIALGATLLRMLPGAIQHAIELRPWTLGERLLSEPRVLFDYLQSLLLPRSTTQGLFHDDFAISTGLLQPATTLLAIVALGLLLVAALRARRRFPILSFAVLFFLAGHVMEGSVVALELYFEHRNYLPAMPLFWPLAVWLTGPGRMPRARLGLSLALPLLLALQLHAGAQLWGDPQRLALTWAANHPASPRAQAYAAQMEMSVGNYAAAQRRLLGALQRQQEEPQLVFNLADAQCALGGLQPDIASQLERAIIASKNSARLDFTWLSGSVETARTNACPGLDLDLVQRLARAVLANPHFTEAPGRRQDSEHLSALILLARGQPEQALTAFNRALMALPRPATALQQAALLGSAGRPDLALCHLSRYTFPTVATVHPWPDMQHVHDWLLQRRNYWPDEFGRLRAQLVEDARALRNDAETPPLTCPES